MSIQSSKDKTSVGNHIVINDRPPYMGVGSDAIVEIYAKRVSCSMCEAAQAILRPELFAEWKQKHPDLA